MKSKNIQKPIDIDAHFKYRCPECANEHWISLNEAKTKNFKIVCDCKTVFKPKRIGKIKIIFAKQKQINQNPPPKDIIQSTVPAQAKQEVNPAQQTLRLIDKDLRDKCSQILMQYGFTQTEARKLISDAYQQEEIKDPLLLVKKALTLIGEINE